MPAKLKLHLEDLTVDSFDTTRSGQARGTVLGEECSCWAGCTEACDPSVGDTCQNSCVGTCGCGTLMSDCDCAGTCRETACGGSPCCL